MMRKSRQPNVVRHAERKLSLCYRKIAPLRSRLGNYKDEMVGLTELESVTSTVSRNGLMLSLLIILGALAAFEGLELAAGALIAAITQS